MEGLMRTDQRSEATRLSLEQELVAMKASLIRFIELLAAATPTQQGIAMLQSLQMMMDVQHCLLSHTQTGNNNIEPIGDLFSTVITQLQGQQFAESSEDEEMEDDSPPDSPESSTGGWMPKATLRPAGLTRADEGIVEVDSEGDTGDESDGHSEPDAGYDPGEHSEPDADGEPDESNEPDADEMNPENFNAENDNLFVGGDSEPDHGPGLGSLSLQLDTNGSASSDLNETVRQLADSLQRERLDDLARALQSAQHTGAASAPALQPAFRPQSIPELLLAIKSLEVESLKQGVLRRYFLKQLVSLRNNIKTQILHEHPGRKIESKVLSSLSLKRMMALAYPDIHGEETVSKSTKEYQSKYATFKQQLVAGRVWCKLDSVFGNWTFALIPTRCQSKIERLKGEKFVAFLERLYQRFGEIQELSLEAARLLEGNLVTG
ncbi:uncharacterized protein PG986_004604 [Apiospora aurea]|uniref:Uncharacterized protein n=1 Tax=Apiospora aurea TaxID=335848 RepID=A0ABR1QN28_9PEZI